MKEKNNNDEKIEAANTPDKDKTISDAALNDKLSELEILRQSVEDKKKLADDYYQQLLRLKADFENFRKRTEKERENYMMWGKENILVRQISLLDVIGQACKSTQHTDNIESIKKGLDLIYVEFNKMLQAEGITEVDCDGKIFDPQCHEAVEEVLSDKPDGTIIEVLQKGYMLNAKVLRAAKVKVAKTEKEIEK